VHGERSLLPQGPMRPDLVVEREGGCDLLGELGCIGDLAEVEVLVHERAAEALDHIVGPRA
jgi:hypothetical protein